MPGILSRSLIALVAQAPIRVIAYFYRTVAYRPNSLYSGVKIVDRTGI
jgi:hypothetical protein